MTYRTLQPEAPSDGVEWTAEDEARLDVAIARRNAKRAQAFADVVAYHDKDQPNGVAWCPGFPQKLKDITPLYAAKEECASAFPPDARDAARYRWLRRGLALTVVIPTPTEDKPHKKTTVQYAPNPEDAWGIALDVAIDAAIKGQ